MCKHNKSFSSIKSINYMALISIEIQIDYLDESFTLEIIGLLYDLQLYFYYNLFMIHV